MIEKLKSALALISGWALAGAALLFWVLSRRHSSPDSSKVEVKPKEVPQKQSDVEKEARKRGLIN
jgi:hypothetical protein